MSSNNIDFNKAWLLEGSSFYVCENEQRILVDYEYLAFSGDVSELVESQLSSLSSIDIIHRILNCSGAWSVVYYRPDLHRLFVGRDIFGQHSLVFSTYSDGLAFSSFVYLQYGDKWNELPYGQITSIDIIDMYAEIHSYLLNYPENSDQKWKEAFKDYRYVYSSEKKNLLEVSRVISASMPFDPVNMLFTHLTDVIQSSIVNVKTSIAVAFSGGVDSLLVAHALLTVSTSHFQIDLVNVAFGANNTICNQAPDRQRAFRAVNHLRERYPGQNFRLILVDVDAEELEYCRAKHICKAAAPAMSVLDDSLACVLWFALRAQGKDAENGDLVQSTSRIFFVGSGADELYAGYARHRNRFRSEGDMSSIAEECEAELRRLGNRNGGRDARVAAQLRRELRAPFLDDKFVAWANSLPIMAKCDLSQPRGIGEKAIIRKALAQLGAPHDSPKQAMQFGSRMAKMNNNGEKIKGSDISHQLLELSMAR